MVRDVKKNRSSEETCTGVSTERIGLRDISTEENKRDKLKNSGHKRRKTIETARKKGERP